ncbi:MAG: ferrous iron transport protein A [Anaerovoracaceae bacterium]
MRTLKYVKVGDTVTVEKVFGQGPLKRRIMDMGITPGTKLRLRKMAPLGDPMEITVRGYELTLRKADADMIQIKEMES